MSYKSKLNVRRVRSEQCGELTDKLVFVNRVAKVVKGGRRFSFSALVVSGDGQGHVGFALGKSGEVPDAISKGGVQAKKRLVRVPLHGTTIPHRIEGKFGPTTVILRPAPPGTGVIAGSTVRSILDAVGIKDIRTKVIGSSTPNNVLEATMNGLVALADPNRVAARRKLSLEEMNYQAF